MVSAIVRLWHRNKFIVDEVNFNFRVMHVWVNNIVPLPIKELNDSSGLDSLKHL